MSTAEGIDGPEAREDRIGYHAMARPVALPDSLLYW